MNLNLDPWDFGLITLVIQMLDTKHPGLEETTYCQKFSNLPEPSTLTNTIEQDIRTENKLMQENNT